MLSICIWVSWSTSVFCLHSFPKKIFNDKVVSRLSVNWQSTDWTNYQLQSAVNGHWNQSFDCAGPILLTTKRPIIACGGGDGVKVAWVCGKVRLWSFVGRRWHVSCFSKIQIGFTFLVPAHLGSPGQRAIKRVCVCECVCVCVCCWVTLLCFQVSSASSYLEPLKSGAVGCASKTMSSKLQMALLDQTKTVVESMQNLMVAAKEAGGNRKVRLWSFGWSWRLSLKVLFWATVERHWRGNQLLHFHFYSLQDNKVWS